MASAMVCSAPAGPENLFTLYHMLEQRWRTKPLFLRRNLACNLHLPDANPKPSVCSTPPSIKPQAPAEAQPIHGDGLAAQADLLEGQCLWELEISASVWVSPSAPQTLAQVGAQLGAHTGAPHLPLFVAFSPAGPLTQADVHIFPVRCFRSGRVPVVQTTKEQAKLVLPLPGTSEGLPQGKLLCIVWDDPNEIRTLGQESFWTQHPVPPLDSVPFGQKGVWAQASIPTRLGASSSSMPVLRKSTITCKSKDVCCGAHFVHVQAATPVLQATLRMKMELRRRAPSTHALAQPNGGQTEAHQAPKPSVPRPPSSWAAQQVAFEYASGDPVEYVLEVTTGWRCPICRRRSSGYEALQLHLLGMHGHFRFFFQEPNGRRGVSFKAAERTQDAEAGNSPSWSAYGANVKYVHWRGRWSSPQAAFHALGRLEEAERREREEKRQTQMRHPGAETDGERNAKRHRVGPSPSHRDQTEEREGGLDESGTATTTPAAEQGSREGPSRKEEAAKRPTASEAGARAKEHDGQKKTRAGEVAECLDAAGPVDDPLSQFDAAGSQHGADDTDRDSGVRGVEDFKAAHNRQWLLGKLEPHRPSPDPDAPKLRRRSESVGAASSAGESGAGVLAVTTTTTTKDGEARGVEEGAGDSGAAEMPIVAVKKKGGSKGKRKPVDTDRNMENLQMRTFYHSRTGMPMDLQTVVNGIDSEDDLDEEEMQRDDHKMLNDFTDVTLEEKEIMTMWNCFARQQRIAADAHMSWASRAFAEVHQEKIGADPGLRRVFMLMLVKFWNCALVSAEDVDDCLKTVDAASDD